MHLLAAIQLFPDGTMFVHIAIILVMIWVLNKTLFKPIYAVLEAREKNRSHQGGEAGAILEDVEAKEAVYTSEIRDARNKGYEIIEQRHNAAVAVRNQALGKAKEEAVAMLDSGRGDIERQAAEARKEIESGAEKMADHIAATILKG
ncbi:MAG TPA: ATP synthase F0 subunit B [Pyrinomonadaceae bacterium]|nr:ATP synthase F0 subunit B [Pyrinomonadaceae bacterium]